MSFSSGFLQNFIREFFTLVQGNVPSLIWSKNNKNLSSKPWNHLAAKEQEKNADRKNLFSPVVVTIYAHWITIAIAIFVHLHISFVPSRVWEAWRVLAVSCCGHHHLLLCSSSHHQTRSNQTFLFFLYFEFEGFLKTQRQDHGNCWYPLVVVRDAFRTKEPTSPTPVLLTIGFVKQTIGEDGICWFGVVWGFDSAI